MKLRKSSLTIAAAIVCCVAMVAPVQAQQAKSSSVKLGDKVIVIPDPEGYEEASLQFEKVKQTFARMEIPTSDGLLLHMPVSDCERIRAGLRPEFRHYTKVSVLKSRREITSSNEDMASFVAEFRKNRTVILDPDGPLLTSVMENLSRQISEASSKEIKYAVDSTQYLGEFDVRPEVYSTMVFVTYKKDGDGTETMRAMVGSMTVLKVRTRIINIAVYHTFSSPAAVKTELKPAVIELKQFTTKWINEILAAN